MGTMEQKGSGTKITSNLLDAVIPTAVYSSASYATAQNGNINAYLDANAKTATVALLNGVVARFDGTYWKPLGDNTKVLSGDFQVQVNLGDIGGVADIGLIYTGQNTPFSSSHRLDTQFGITNHSISAGTKSTQGCNWINEHMNSTNICAVRGMRLPTWNELDHDDATSTYATCSGSASQGTGVPAYNNGASYTWSASAYSSGSSNYWAWSSTTNGNSRYYYNNSVRCVR